MSTSAGLAWGLALILAIGALLLGIHSNLLRDTSAAARRPFSFARVQLLWWVLIIAFCFLHQYGLPLELPVPNETCLVLLGIGVGTTTVAQVLDGRQRQVGDRHGIQVTQDMEGQGFFNDILSDDNGVSVHRLQALVFNVIYGAAFFTHFVREQTFDTYGTVQYAVLGLSSAGYLGLKALENDPENRPQTHNARVSSDELLDMDSGVTGPAAVG